MDQLEEFSEKGIHRKFNKRRTLTFQENKINYNKIAKPGVLTSNIYTLDKSKFQKEFKFHYSATLLVNESLIDKFINPAVRYFRAEDIRFMVETFKPFDKFEKFNNYYSWNKLYDIVVLTDDDLDLLCFMELKCKDLNIESKVILVSEEDHCKALDRDIEVSSAHTATGLIELLNGMFLDKRFDDRLLCKLKTRNIVRMVSSKSQKDKADN